MTMLFAVFAIVLGSVGALRVGMVFGRGESVRTHLAWEIFGVVAALTSLPIGVIVLRNEKIGAAAAEFGTPIVVFAFFTIIVFFSRLRPMAEGLGAIALGIASIITGFTIGALLAPFALVLGIVSFRHSTESLKHSLSAVR